MVRLNVCLEDGDDRRADALGLRDITRDQRLVRIDDPELAVREAAEEVRGARGLVVEEGTEDHGSQRTPSLGIALDEVGDTCYR